jgi:DNA-binding MarR family transcriptional regulator
MTPEDVENAVYRLIELGLAETAAIDEDGNFTYRLTKEGREVAEKLHQKDFEDE